MDNANSKKISEFESGTALAERVTRVLDRQLFQATVAQKVHNIGKKTRDPDKMIMSIFGVIDKVIEFHMASIIVIMDEEEEKLLLWISKSVNQGFVDNFKEKTLNVLREQGLKKPSDSTDWKVNVVANQEIIAKGSPKDNEVRSFHSLPFRLVDRILGLLVIGDPEPNAFNKDELQVLSSIAQESALIIADAVDFSKLIQKIGELTHEIELINQKNRELYEDAKKRVFELSVLYNVSKNIGTSLNYQHVLKLMMESLSKIIDYDFCASCLFDFKELSITVRKLVTEDLTNEAKRKLFEAIKIFTEQKINPENLKVVLNTEISDTASVEQVKETGQLNSFFNVPLIVEGVVIGMVNISSVREKAFSEEDIALLYSLAEHTAIAIKRLKDIVEKARNRIELMIEELSHGMIMTDENDNIKIMNNVAKKMLGFGAEIDLSDRRLLEKAKNLHLTVLMKEVLASKNGVVKKQVQLQEPYEMILEITAGPVKDIGELTIGTISILEDVTEKVKAHEALRREKDKLEYVNKLMMGRELRMIELKKEVDVLRKELGKDSRYGY